MKYLPPLAAALLLTAAARGDDPPPKPAPNRADEPLAKELSLTRAAEFLDAASAHWTAVRGCVTCHTNMTYLMARPALKEAPSKTEAAVRAFFEQRVAGWDGEAKKDRPANDSEVVATAAALAFHDAATSGKLHERTRQALDRMWTIQQEDGAWDWEKCGWPPLEHDDYYGAVLASLAAGVAPDGYAATDKAKAGLEKARGYFRKNAPPTLHHKAWLMWASTRVDGLMTAKERAETVKELLAAQRKDGGWSLPSLGAWKGFDGRANDVEAASDGYATGLAVYLLRQAGTPADRDEVKKGVAWLKANQRESGRWFTRSLNTDRYHFISHAGTAFAVLALKACEGK